MSEEEPKVYKYHISLRFNLSVERFFGLSWLLEVALQ